MLNSNLQRWMRGNPFSNTDLTAEMRREWTNDNLFFPVVGLTTTKKANEIFEQHIPSINIRTDELISDLTKEKKEQQNEILFFPVAALATAKRIEQNIPPLSKEEKERQNEYLFFPVAAIAAAEKTNDIFERHIPLEAKEADDIFERRHAPEDNGQEEFIFESIILEDSFKKIINDLSSQTQQNLTSQNEENYSNVEPLLAIEEEAAAQGSDKVDLLSSLYIEENFSSVKTQESLDQAKDESNSLTTETTSEVKIETIIHDEPKKNENLADLTEDELSRAYEEKKARAAAFAEEYRKSREEIIEHNGKIRKNHILWLGLSFICVLVLTIASVLYFLSEKTMEPARDFDPSIFISNIIDKNADDFEDIVLDSNYLNSISSDNESRFEESEDIAVFGVTEGSRLSDSVVSSDLGQSAYVAKSEDSINQSGVINIVSSEPVSIDFIIVERIDNDRRPVNKNTGNNVKSKVNETVRISRTAERMTGTTSETAKSSEIDSVKVNRMVSSRVYSRNISPPVRSTEKYSRKGVDSTQNNIFSAIKSERYHEAINLSKINLERNPKDRLSFYSLGIALYAISDFSGATRAFYNCLAFDSPNLPAFMVEEFDSAESLENLYINYPGVESLIRSVEINPKDKSLYLNLFLSNIKSEKPRENSEIYYAIYNHAERHGSNNQNMIKEKGV